MIELNRLYNADYLDGIKDIDDKSIDLIVTDPPYLFDNGNWYKSDILGENSVYTNSELYDNFGMMKTEMGQFGEDDIATLYDAVIPKMKKVNMFFFCCEEQVPIYGMEARKRGLHYNILVWEKPLSIINKNRFSMNTEYVVRVYDFGTGLNRLNNNEVYNKVLHDSRVTDKIHPTQKPVALYAWILKNYAQPGDKIFDPMMGSQSSRIAAYKMGFDYVGCELDPDYFAAGCARFDRECRGIERINGKTITQQSLF